MLVPPTEGLRVAKYAEGAGYAPDQWARALAAVDWDQAQLLSDKPDSSVWRAELVVQKRPMTLVIKCERLVGIGDRLKSMLKRSKVYQQWRGAERFKAIFSPAKCFAILRSGDIELLVMESLEGETLLGTIAHRQLTVSEERSLSRAFAWDAGRLMMSTGWRDMKGSNLVVTRLESERSVVRAIDTVGVGKEHEVHGLFPMVAEAIGCGVLPRKACLMRFLSEFVREYRNWELYAPNEEDASAKSWERQERRAVWRCIEEGLKAHGDPTPKHNPFGPVGNRPHQD